MKGCGRGCRKEGVGCRNGCARELEVEWKEGNWSCGWTRRGAVGCMYVRHYTYIQMTRRVATSATDPRPVQPHQAEWLAFTQHNPRCCCCLGASGWYRRTTAPTRRHLSPRTSGEGEANVAHTSALCTAGTCAGGQASVHHALLCSVAQSVMGRGARRCGRKSAKERHTAAVAA